MYLNNLSVAEYWSAIQVKLCCLHSWYSSPQSSLEANPEPPTLGGGKIDSWVPSFQVTKIFLNFGASSSGSIKKNVF